MGNKARKERKRRGEPFVKPAKVGTPLPLQRRFRYGSARTQQEMMSARGIEIQIRHKHDEHEETTND